MKINTSIIATFMLLTTFNLNAADIGVGLKAVTHGEGVGYGADFTVNLTKNINARVSLTSLDHDSSEDFRLGDTSNKGNVDVDLDANIGSSSLLFDWHVFDGGFHITSGLLKFNGEIKYSGTLKDDFSFNGLPLSSSDINGSVSGEVKLGDSFSPYVGIGWGRKASPDGGFSVSAELGAALLDPKVDVNAIVNSSGKNKLTQAQLDSRLQSAMDDYVDEFKTYPIVSLGINYAF